MNFKNPFKKPQIIQNMDKYITFNDGSINVFNNVAKGIADELINMRCICYIAQGDEAVKTFDKKLIELFPEFQTSLMKHIVDKEEKSL
jgi:hypothetical protein